MSEQLYGPLADSIARKHGIEPKVLRLHISRQNAWAAPKPKPLARRPAPARAQSTSIPGLSVAAIDRFIGQGNPLAAAGGAQTLLRATGGNLAGAAFLAALARKESSFGAAAGRFTNNYWGWGVHLGSSVNTSRTVEEGARKVWTGLQSSLYKGSGLTNPTQIISKYAPPSENNTALYQQQVNSWFTQMGLSPQTNIFSGATVPVPGGGAVPPATPTGTGSIPQAGSLDTKRLMMLLDHQRQRSLQGIMPAAGFQTELQKVVSQALPRAQVNATGQQVGAQASQAGRTVAQAAPSGGQYSTPFGTTFSLPGLPSEVRPVAPTSTIKNPKGQAVAISTFDGKPVSSWWASMLSFARSKGWKGSVSSGYRDVAQQQILWDRYGHNPARVAHPGSSPHNYGMAVDISDGPGLERIIKAYHLPIARYAAEGWHFEPLGFRTNGTQKTF